MTTMTRKLWTTAAVLGIAASSAVPAVASTESTQALRLIGDPNVNGSNSVTVIATNIERRTLELVCWTFNFSGDLIDTGEGLTITPDDLDPGAGPGFQSVSDEPTATRTLCVDDPTFLAEIADGNAVERFVVEAYPGSSTFTLASVTMTLTYA